MREKDIKINIKDIKINDDFAPKPDEKWDPDKRSKKLREYHRVLWWGRKPFEELKELNKNSTDYLWFIDADGVKITLGADNIVALYRKYKRYNKGEIKTAMDKHPLLKYTIGGSLLFPNKKKDGVQTINQIRGTRVKIADRIDITLLCIKLWYENKEKDPTGKNPLFESIKKNEKFFNLFKDFNEYVDFFFLNDFVNDDYEPINLFNENREKLGEEVLGEKKNNYPKDYKEWEKLYDNLKECIKGRSEKIWKYLGRDEKDFHFEIERQKNG